MCERVSICLLSIRNPLSSSLFPEINEQPGAHVVDCRDSSLCKLPICLHFDQGQITHPDDDHIGNAAAFLIAMCDTDSTTEYVKNCNVVFSQIPSLYEKPTITATRPTFLTGSDGNDLNWCAYTASVSQSWREVMEKSGFALDISLYPQNDTILGWDFDNFHAEWDDDTQNRVSKPTCTLYYMSTSDAVGNKLKPELEAQVRIFLPEQGNLEATLKLKKDKKKAVRKWWEVSVSKNRDLLSSVSREVPLTEYQLESKLQSSEVFDLEPWTSGRPLKRVRLPQIAKLMSNMVTRQPLATATSKAINSNMKSAVKAEPHIIHSVNQVLELGTVITDLNKKDTKPNLKPVVPVASS